MTRCLNSSAGKPTCAFCKSSPCTACATRPCLIRLLSALIGTLRREYLDRMFFWNRVDLEQKLENFKGKGTAPAYGPKLASIWLSVALSLPESFLGQNLPGHLHLPTFLPQLTVVLHTGQCLIWTFNSVVIRD